MLATALVHRDIENIKPAQVAGLYVKNFRNHEALSLRVPSPAPVVLTGANGSGKTSLLEALSLFAPGRGLRQASGDKILYNKAKENFYGVSIRLCKPSGVEDSMSLLCEQSASAEGFLVKVKNNGRQTSLVNLASQLSLFWLTPAQARFFNEGSSRAERRKFMDRLVAGAEKEHVAHLNAFERVKKQRQLLLEQNSTNTTWLAVLEKQMAQLAFDIETARATLLLALNKKMKDLNPEGFPLGVGSVQNENVEASVDAYQALFESTRGRDRAAGRTLSGPHRADFYLFNQTQDQPALECSTGEIKALLVGLILAAAELTAGLKAHAPIILLDEVAAHLDEGRRYALLNRLGQSATQFWLTGTDPKTFAPLKMDAHFFDIQPNRAQPR